MTQTYELVEWTLDGKTVSVPHDAMLSEKRSADAPTGNAGAYFHGGVYRYTREITAPQNLERKRVALEFEGVMGRTGVYVDGRRLASHAYGYTGFSVDLSRALEAGKTSTVEVVANNSAQPNSRWYSGSGLYRPVRLVIQDSDRIVRGGIVITTECASPARIRVQTTVEGHGTPYVRIERNGRAVAGRSGSDVRLGIPDARLWSAEDPYLYTCHVLLRGNDGELLDEARVSFGIRTLEWNNRGLLINGEPVKLRGGCVHHDNGILGATDLPAASRRKIAILKQWGFNAIRSSHNPLSESMLAACDELGMYVLDEYADMWYRHKNPYDYASDYEANHAADLAAMVQKDRNHPCVIMYSIGNENAEPVEDLGVLTARLLATTVRRLDPTRPVTAGVNPTILFAAGLGIDSFNGGGEADGTTGGAGANKGSVRDQSASGGADATGGHADRGADDGSGGACTGAGAAGGIGAGGASGQGAGAAGDIAAGGNRSGGASGQGADSVNRDAAGASANASLAYNTYVAKMGDVMERMAGTHAVGRAVAPFLDELDVAGYNYATRRYKRDLHHHPERLVFGSETMPYALARNWRLVESDPRIIGDFMWTSWDYLGECSLAAWSDDPTPVSKPYPWLCADTGALDLIGNPNGEAALARTVWGSTDEPLLYVRPADLPKPCTAPWRGTNSIPCWSWHGCEGNQTTVEVYTRAPIAKLYLNGRHVGTKRVRNFHADFRLRYTPGELVAVSCTSSGLELGRTSLRSGQGQLRLRLETERIDHEVAFVRVDAVDTAGVVEGTANNEVTVRVRSGKLLAFGSAAQKSERSYVDGTFPLRYGRGLAVVRLNKNSPCTISASAPGLASGYLTISLKGLTDRTSPTPLR